MAKRKNMAEICDECGKSIKMNKWDKLKHIWDEKILCSKCYDKISGEFYLGD